jgi:peptide-methionine (S)-S-oxide reductase
MTKRLARSAALHLAGVFVLTTATLAGEAGRFPDPARDTPRAAAKDMQTAVLAGGCFWGVEAVFEELEGVTDVTSGYAGGTAQSAHYELVASGRTGHAEAVKITYDASRITYGQLLKVFFAIAHDPTELNRQGPDVGPQYRSSIFYGNDEQKQVATAYIEQLNAARLWAKPIATTIVPLQGYHLAEDQHQDFLRLHPTYPYIVQHDLPKLAALRAQLPELLKQKKNARK